MAAEMGISPSSVGRIWAEAGLKPHLVRRFKISNDPQFEEKVTDVVGLYMNPPDRALVLCVDEKSQIQALDRTQPGLPLKRGRAATMSDHGRSATSRNFRRNNPAVVSVSPLTKFIRAPCECQGFAMSPSYLNIHLTPSYAVPLQTEFRLSPGDGLEGLPSCPTWF